MKTFFLMFALIAAGLVIGTNPAPTVKAAATKHRAVMTFDAPVRLQGVILQGEYLFIHDDAAMARGEACTYVYKGNVESPSKLVASFHCTPVERKKVAHFTWRAEETAPGVVELKEFQFGGETEGHMVPFTIS